MVLDGTQSDENGDYAAGTVVTNAMGTRIPSGRRTAAPC